MSGFGLKSTPTGGSYVNADGSEISLPSQGNGRLQTLGGWFDVTHYGAEGDGSTDDTSAFNDAIDACAAAGGGTVFVPVGKYKITAQLHDLPAQSKLLGAGKGGFDPDAGFANASVIESYLASDPAISFYSTTPSGLSSRYSSIENISFKNKTDQYSAFLQSPKTITLVEAAGGGMMRFTSTAHGYANGDQVTISGVTGTGGLPAAANKTWRSVRASYTILTATDDGGGAVEIKTDRAHRLVTGDSVVVAGNSVSGYNGTWTVTVPNSTAITGLTNDGQLWKVTAVNHGFSTGDQVEIRGCFPSGSGVRFTVNGVWTITVLDADTFDLDGSQYVAGFTFPVLGASDGVVMPTTFTLDSSTYSADGTGGTVSQPNKFTVDDNLSFNDQASLNIQNADFVGAYTAGGTAQRFDQTLFDAGAACAVEMMNVGNCRVTHCSFIDYPVGIAYDASEMCEIDHCLFGGVDLTYSDFHNSTIQLWVTDGTHRGKSGNDSSTNTLTVRHIQMGGAYSFRLDCGDFMRFERVNFEGGRKMFDCKGGITQTVVTNCTGESCDGTFVHIQSASLQVRFESNFIATSFSNDPVFKFDATVDYLQLVSNYVGSKPYSTALVGCHNINNLFAVGNNNSNVGGLLYDVNPIGASFVNDHDNDDPRVGVGINIAKVRALLHGQLQDYSYPLIKIVDTFGDKFLLDAPSAGKQRAFNGLKSATTGWNDSGPMGATERLDLAAAASPTNFAGFTVPQHSYAVGKVFLEVVVMTTNDPTKYARWVRSQWVRCSFGTPTLIGSPVDEQTAEDTDGGYAANPPILAISGGDVLVQVQGHASVTSHWIALVNVTWCQE